MEDELLAAEGFEEVFNILKEAPLRTFAADKLLEVAFRDPSVMERLSEMKEEQWDSLMEQVAKQPRPPTPPMLPPTPPLSPRLQELLDQVEFDEDEEDDDEDEDDEDEDEEESDSSDSDDDGINTLGDKLGDSAVAVVSDVVEATTVVGDLGMSIVKGVAKTTQRVIIKGELVSDEEEEESLDPLSPLCLGRSVSELPPELSDSRGSVLTGAEAEWLRNNSSLFPHETALYTRRYRAMAGTGNRLVAHDLLLALFRAPGDVASSSVPGEDVVAVGEEASEALPWSPPSAADEASPSVMVSRRILSLMDIDQDGQISLFDYLQWIAKLLRGTTDERAKLAWEVYDVNGRGVVSRRDMTTVLSFLLELMVKSDADVGELKEPDAIACSQEEMVAVVVDYTFEIAGIPRGDGMELAPFSRLCQTRDTVLRQCVPDLVGIDLESMEEKLKCMNAELAEAQEELISAPRHQRAMLKRRVHRLDLVSRQIYESHKAARAAAACN